MCRIIMKKGAPRYETAPMLLFDTLKSEQTIDNHGITNHKIGLTAIVGAGLVPALFPSGVMN